MIAATIQNSLDFIRVLSALSVLIGPDCTPSLADHFGVQYPIRQRFLGFSPSNYRIDWSIFYVF